MPRFDQVGESLPRIEAILDVAEQSERVLEARILMDRLDTFTEVVDTIIDATVISAGATYKKGQTLTERNVAAWEGVTGVDATSFARYDHLEGRWF